MQKKTAFDLDWNHYNLLRTKFSDNYQNVPILSGDEKKLALRFVPNGCRLLDVGANNRCFQEYLAGKEVRYFSMDTSRSLPHDFYSLEEIKGKRFDVAVLFQVLEHLEREEAHEYLDALSACVSRIILTIPNVFGPHWVFFLDDTHKTQYGYRTLGALLESHGFEAVKIFRISGTSHLFVKSIVSRFTSVDFCHSILVVAEKTPKRGNSFMAKKDS